MNFFPHVCLFFLQTFSLSFLFPCVLCIHFALFQSLVSISACQHQIAYILKFSIKQQLRGNDVLFYLKIQVKRFSLIIIPVTPSQWQGWGEWAQCSTSCGKGTKIRARACSKSDGSCPGEPTETKGCLVAECPGFPFCSITYFDFPSFQDLKRQLQLQQYHQLQRQLHRHLQQHLQLQLQHHRTYYVRYHFWICRFAILYLCLPFLS